MLEPFDIAGAGAFSVEALHLLFEASRLAYADRNEFLADNKQLAEDGGLSPAQVISGLLSPDYLAMRSAMIVPAVAAEEVAAGDPSPYADDGAGVWRPMGKDASPEPPSTTHFVIVDGDGNVVSMSANIKSLRKTRTKRSRSPAPAAGSALPTNTGSPRPCPRKRKK